MNFTRLCFAGILLCFTTSAQSIITVTGTPIPPSLLRQNFGRLPKEIGAYDLNICNLSAQREFVTSSEVLQSLAGTQGGIQPIGRDIMLSAVLRNQNRNPATFLPVALNAVTGLLSFLGSSRNGTSAGLWTGVALGALSAQQLLFGLKPVLYADSLQKFESQVLPQAFALDSKSCVEHTVFALNATQHIKPLAFHLR